jgi:hypothetical protein
MRVPLCPLVLALAIVAFVTRPASADAIVHDYDVAADGTLQTFTGDFEWDNDVALITFVLGEGVFDFTASTTSYAPSVGGFDPVLSLYFAPTGADPLALSLYTYVGLGGGIYPATNDDQDFDNGAYDSLLTLRLVDAGTYILALTQTGNFAQEGFSFDLADDQFQCFARNADGSCEELFGGRSSTFAGSLSVTDVNAAPVPEPGTLSLLGLGALATCLRRRHRRFVTTRQ